MLPDEVNVLKYLIAIHENVAEIKAKFDGLTTRLDQHIKEDDDNHKDHEGRLRDVEDSQKRFKWIAVGVGTVLAVIWRVASLFFQGHDFFR